MRGAGRRPALRLGEESMARLVSWARRARPAEACGLLLGERAAGGADDVLVHRVLPARNLLAGAATPRFEVDPGALVAGEAAARREGWELVGIWHSHVDRAALLSAADRDGAWGGHHQLVLALVGTDGVEARSYRCRSERAGGSSPTWVEEELRVVPTASPSRLTPRS